MDKVVHFEIPVDDRERATEFYRTVFEWNLVHMPEMRYTIAGTVDVGEDQLPTERGADQRRADGSERPDAVAGDHDRRGVDRRLPQEGGGRGGSVVSPRTPIPGWGRSRTSRIRRATSWGCSRPSSRRRRSASLQQSPATLSR